jgi:hypothetical protein
MSEIKVGFNKEKHKRTKHRHKKEENGKKAENIRLKKYYVTPEKEWKEKKGQRN